MLKRLAQIALIAGGLVVLLMVLTMGWLKAHETRSCSQRRAAGSTC